MDVEVEGGDVGPIWRNGVYGSILGVVSGWVAVAIALWDGNAFDEERVLVSLSREHSDAPAAQLLECSIRRRYFADGISQLTS